jgi:protein-S-isoprenylcysteine O-methyltransferase Ste14
MIWVAYIISTICLWVLLSAVTLNFFFSKNKIIVKEKKSVVETGSMLAFFIFNVLVVYLKVGALNLGDKATIIMAFVGMAFIASGTIVNVAGRLALKGNWGNQIRIYEHHTLVKSGVYRCIRHPLYASTILMLYGFSLLFGNMLVFLLNTLIFIPFMVSRAKQEDVLLASAFPDTFTEYKGNTGLFFPKIIKGDRIK